jgi:hypothetical protein
MINTRVHTVVVSLCLGAVLLASPASSSGGGGYHFARTPVVTYAIDAAGAPQFSAYIRLTRSLPRVNGKSLRATIRIDGFGSRTAPEPGASANGFFSMRSTRHRYCYGQSFAVFPDTDRPPSLDHPKTGQRVKVQLLVSGRKGVVAEAFARMTRAAKDDEGVADRKLGCVA